MTPLEVLKATRELLKDEENWCQGDFELGGKRCLLGALRVAAGAESGDSIEGLAGGLYSAYAVARAQLRFRTPRSLIGFNDSHPHADVIGLLDQTILELETLDAAQH